MKIISCTSGTIVIKLDDDFSGITICASGERILNWEGFCISAASIKQIEPDEKAFSAKEKKDIAIAISKCNSLTMPIEFYEVL